MICICIYQCIIYIVYSTKTILAEAPCQTKRHWTLWLSPWLSKSSRRHRRTSRASSASHSQLQNGHEDPSTANVKCLGLGVSGYRPRTCPTSIHPWICMHFVFWFKGTVETFPAVNGKCLCIHTCKLWICYKLCLSPLWQQTTTGPTRDAKEVLAYWTRQYERWQDA